MHSYIPIPTHIHIHYYAPNYPTIYRAHTQIYYNSCIHTLYKVWPISSVFLTCIVPTFHSSRVRLHTPVSTQSIHGEIGRIHIHHFPDYIAAFKYILHYIFRPWVVAPCSNTGNILNLTMSADKYSNNNNVSLTSQLLVKQ